jgi:DNA-binding GntR family transcriptional regulator
MNFRAATDGLCEKLDHSDLAEALGVSVQTIRQARLQNENGAHRTPPSDWEGAVIRLAEKRVWHYRRLIERLRHNGQDEDQRSA